MIDVEACPFVCESITLSRGIHFPLSALVGATILELGCCDAAGGDLVLIGRARSCIVRAVRVCTRDVALDSVNVDGVAVTLYVLSLKVVGDVAILDV